MATYHLRRRYLLALGISSGVLGGCAGGDGNPPPITETSTGTGSTPTSTTDASAAVTSPLDASATASTTPSGTAAPVASAAVASWEPKVPDPAATRPQPQPERPLPSCPNGRFCVAQADAKGASSADAPFEACAASIPLPHAESSMDARKQIRFDAATTKRERTQTKDACCYSWYIPCPGGRPLLVDGFARTAAESSTTAWLDASYTSAFADVAEAPRRALAEHYAAEASYEHASIASFARVSLSLLAAGAPADLVTETHRAALDEVAHARALYALASACRGEPVGPGPLDVAGASLATSSVVAIAEEAFFEGCVGEVTAALVLREESGRATSAPAERLFASMADDEERHAELAWRTVAWALSREPDGVRAMLERASERILAEADDIAAAMKAPEPAGEALPGVTTPRERTSIRARAILEVTAPCLTALLAREPAALV